MFPERSTRIGGGERKKFQLNTSGCCFLCFADVGASTEKNGNLLSLSAILQHLGINLKDIFASSGSGSALPMPEVVVNSMEGSDFIAELCSKCKQLCGRTLEKMQTIEKLIMELNHCFKSIQGEMATANKSITKLEEFRKRMQSDVWAQIFVKPTEDLRKTFMDKCSKVADKQLSVKIGRANFEARRRDELNENIPTKTKDPQSREKVATVTTATQTTQSEAEHGNGNANEANELNQLNSNTLVNETESSADAATTSNTMNDLEESSSVQVRAISPDTAETNETPCNSNRTPGNSLRDSSENDKSTVNSKPERRRYGTICRKNWQCGSQPQIDNDESHNPTKHTCNCKECSTSSSRKGNLTLRRKLNFRKTKTCKLCKRTVSEAKYVIHLEECPKLRKFSCMKCSKKFANKSSLGKHYRSCLQNENIRPMRFSCHKCNRGFRTESLLNQHLKRARGHQDINIKFICKQLGCEETFPTQQELSIHVKEKHAKNKKEAAPTGKQNVEGKESQSNLRSSRKDDAHTQDDSSPDSEAESVTGVVVSADDALPPPPQNSPVSQDEDSFSNTLEGNGKCNEMMLKDEPVEECHEWGDDLDDIEVVSVDGR